ncbi:MAG: glucoamylase family protein [Clostridia bacterium]|nr:glucoamylase family protein [Clostridia bacterium]
MGTDISEIIKMEHFDIAVRKVSIGNSITSIKELKRINFQEIFEDINGVEEILKKDPIGMYDRMDYKTKEYYRGIIKNISKKRKVSEIYIAKNILDLADKSYKELQELKNISGEKELKINKILEKKSHVGYYLLDQVDERKTSLERKTLMYISFAWGLSILLSIIISAFAKFSSSYSTIIKVILAIILVVPIQELVNKLFQYILGKIVKPKLIPKLDFASGIDRENTTFVVIPTIVKSKEKVNELFKKLEVYYIANKTDNLYLTLLGDCSSGEKELEDCDEEVIKEGIKCCEELNEKYKDEVFAKFNFIYRKRVWNEAEGCFLGWERKRGMLNQFNEYILGNISNPFRVNTIEQIKKKLPKVKYIITLDSDTDLVLQSGLELIGAMAHPLNKPILNKGETIVVDGYGIMQPRVGIDMEISMKNLFTKIYAGAGGVDSYTNAISDFYQDNLGEGIFTGKGIYDLKVFSKVLGNVIPENLVLSHDLLEGNYLRCGLVSDIILMDGYPTSYNSFKTRQHRWIRGDFQIMKWLKGGNPLNLLSKYKIFDNLVRASLPIFLLLSIIFLFIIDEKSVNSILTLILVITAFPTVLSVINKIVYKKENEKIQRTFSKKIGMLKASIIRGILEIGLLPDKAYTSLDAIVRTLHRLKIKKHLLEWTTAEEAEKLAKSDLKSYYHNMKTNIFFGITVFMISKNLYFCLISVLWLITPFIMWYLAKPILVKNKIEELTKDEIDYINEIGRKTWTYFKDYLTKENNYLPPDNYQEDRNKKTVDRTSSTNIGLAMLAVISGYDLKYENLQDTMDLLDKMITVIEGLPKWNGHLYNWYNINSLEPLNPKYISTVDSGNFIGYLYIVRSFLNNNKGESEKIQSLINIVDRIIDNTDFTKLYDYEKRLFSIGYNIEENKLTDSYYDLLASEARQASLVAIAKKDVTPKHWYNLSRTLTVLNRYRGLISWSGTAFEYLMPNINIKKYEGGLLDESCKFMIMSQKEYAKKIGIPWGFSESAFNLKDLNNNYQYKAFGIPWLGLKRGLADEIVISSYGSFLAINDDTKDVVINLKRLEEQGMVGKYGFYEAIDYTPSRLKKDEKKAVVKSYMAHHQGLILLSINNLFNDSVLQKRFMENAEIASIDILLQENIPESYIITKEQKEKPEKIVYKDYENYTQRVFTKIDNESNSINVISNGDYSILVDVKGGGYSKYKDIQINRYKETSDIGQGILFYIKNIKSKRIWASNIMNYMSKPDKYRVTFAPDRTEFYRIDGNIQTTKEIGISSTGNVELRRITLKNTGNQEEILEISSFLEPILSRQEQDNSHPAFNNLFLSYDFVEELNTMIIKRKAKSKHDKEIFLGVSLYTEKNCIGELEYEIDKERFNGRDNFNLPKIIETSRPFSKNIGLTLDPIISFKKTISIPPNEEVSFTLLICVSNDRQVVLDNIEEFSNEENIKRSFKHGRVRVESEIQYLGLKGTDIELYQKMLGYILFKNLSKSILQMDTDGIIHPKNEIWKYGISGDLPILLVKIKDVNDIYVVREVLKAYEYYKAKNIELDLVIVNEERYRYEGYVKEAIYNAILNANLSYLLNMRGGIFVLENIKDLNNIKFRANLILDCADGRIENQLKEIEEEFKSSSKDIPDESKKVEIARNAKIENTQFADGLKYFNSYGGFREDGKEYKIRVNKENRLPTVWSHIIANERFGSLVTESGGGYTWSNNSRLNKLTSWSNNQVQDIPSEVIYMEDEETGKKWSVCVNPMPDGNDYYVTYGFGYAKYLHKSAELEERLKVFVPKNEKLKINLLNIKNLEPKKKKIKIVYYIKPVLDEDEINSNSYLDIKFDRSANIIHARNMVNEDFKSILYVSSSEGIKSYTGESKFFFGNGGLHNPDGLKKISLNNENGLGKSKQIIAIELKFEIEAYGEKDISIILGAEEELINCKDMAYKYLKIENCRESYFETKKYWSGLINTLQVETPVESMNIMLNGWLVYQTIVCRLFAKSAFYQSGGACRIP